jgi:hypothetical protein
MARSQFCFRPLPISRKKCAAGNLRKWTLPSSRVLFCPGQLSLVSRHPLERGGRIHLILHGHTPRLQRARSMCHQTMRWNQVGFRVKADFASSSAVKGLWRLTPGGHQPSRNPASQAVCCRVVMCYYYSGRPTAPAVGCSARCWRRLPEGRKPHVRQETARVAWHLGVRLRDFSRRWAFWLETEAALSLKLAVNLRLELRIQFRARPRFR